MRAGYLFPCLASPDAKQCCPCCRWELPAPPKLHFQTLQANKRKELQRLSDLYLKNLDAAGVDFFEGRGRVVDAHTVEVNGKQYKARCFDCCCSAGMHSSPPFAMHACVQDGIRCWAGGTFWHSAVRYSGCQFCAVMQCHSNTCTMCSCAVNYSV